MVIQTQQCVSRCKISKITNKAPCFAKCKTPKVAGRKMLPQPVINEKSCSKCRQPQIAGKFSKSTFFDYLSLREWTIFIRIEGRADRIWGHDLFQGNQWQAHDIFRSNLRRVWYFSVMTFLGWIYEGVLTFFDCWKPTYPTPYPDDYWALTHTVTMQLSVKNEWMRFWFSLFFWFWSLIIPCWVDA